MDRYQGWKWYDTGLIILLLIAALYCIIIMSDYFMGVACLAVILMSLLQVFIKRGVIIINPWNYVIKF